MYAGDEFYDDDTTSGVTCTCDHLNDPERACDGCALHSRDAWVRDYSFAQSRQDREFRLLQAARLAIAAAGTNAWPVNLDGLRAAVSEYDR